MRFVIIAFLLAWAALTLIGAEYAMQAYDLHYQNMKAN